MARPVIAASDGALKQALQHPLLSCVRPAIGDSSLRISQPRAAGGPVIAQRTIGPTACLRNAAFEMNDL